MQDTTVKAWPYSGSQMPPKPHRREERVGVLAYFRMFRHDILSAQPRHLFRTWMAEMRTLVLRSYLCNDPKLVDLVLKKPAQDFPKSERLRVGVKPLLGESIFISNGAIGARQRRIIDPAFEGGRLRLIFPAMWDSATAAVARLQAATDGRPVEIEAEASHLAMDVIFRTLFSVPIENEIASAAFAAFRAHQQAQPLANIAAVLPFPRWVPRFHPRKTRETARLIRDLMAKLVDQRAAKIAAGTAPDDLATKIMTTPDTETSQCFTRAEMVDQVAIFFLAGHETSAAALSWALYPDWQDKVADEVTTHIDPSRIYFSALSNLRISRAVFRETLRLYPPVPMYVRAVARPETFRARSIKRGAQVILSPWHLHRHKWLWVNPDGFDPTRFDTAEGKQSQRDAYIPFSAGARVCPGSVFAMAEGSLLLSMLVRAFRFDLIPDRAPISVAQLTLRAKDCIYLKLTPRLQQDKTV